MSLRFDVTACLAAAHCRTWCAAGTLPRARKGSNDTLSVNGGSVFGVDGVRRTHPTQGMKNPRLT